MTLKTSESARIKETADVDAHVREASLSDYDQIAAVMVRNGLRTRPRDAWVALWKGNPAYERTDGRWPIGWVLEAEGRLVGCVANVPCNYVFRGELVRAAAECDWAVDKPYRRFALLLWERHTRQENVELLLTTTVSAASEKTYGVFQWAPAPVGRWDRSGYWIAGYRGFLRSALLRKAVPCAGWMQYPLALGLLFRDRLMGGGPPRVGIAVQWSATFDVRFEAFWKELQCQKPDVLLALRDRATLSWHFQPGNPRQNAWIATLSRGSLLLAYAVFVRRDHPRSGLKRLRLVDFQALEDAPQALSSILAKALARCRAEGIHMLEDIGCLADRTGVPAPHRRQLEAWLYYYRAVRKDLRDALQDPSRWAPTSYDGDLSL